MGLEHRATPLTFARPRRQVPLPPQMVESRHAEVNYC
jgi:hypothetical protein